MSGLPKSGFVTARSVKIVTKAGPALIVRIGVRQTESRVLLGVR